MNTMPISELIEQVTEICKKNGDETAGFIWFFCNRNIHTNE